jgi:uncharacterized protein
MYRADMRLSSQMTARSRNKLLAILLFSTFLSSLPMSASDFVRISETWRTERANRLQAPDGWLSLIGLHWLQSGANTIGSGSDSTLKLSAGPEHFGTVFWVDGGKEVVFEPAPGVAVISGGQPVTGRIPLHFGEGKPTVVQCGSVSFFVIQRGDKLGLRVKDTESPRRKHFVGLDWYPVDSSWRIDADWVPFDPPHEVKITNVLGQTSSMPVPGKAVFTRDGKTYELIPVDEGADEPLFFIIRDTTSGSETYGASRFLYAERPKDGKVVLDFNQAQNPPCAFTPFATCPLPPKENRLPFAVTAGEKNYRGEQH